ncbi:MAG: hypothetical protein QGD94_04975, partial [Planctomycetia bacterium]|nr:hypothetical protein [Planctomycetia bacterium]
SFADRFGDFALYLRASVYFLRRPEGPDLMYVILCWCAMATTYLISYLGARGGEEGASARVGFWRRGERTVTLLIGMFRGHMMTALWILSTWAFLTVLQRIWVIRRSLAEAEGRTVPRAGGFVGAIRDIVFFNHPRGSLVFDIHAGTVILILLIVPEPLFSWLGALV